MSTVERMIDRDKLYKEIKYTPHSVLQWNAHNSTARFRIPCCGRRWGKSTFAAREMTEALFIPDSYYWIVGPNYALGEKEFRIVHHDIHFKLGFKDIKGYRQSYNPKQGQMMIKMPWNTVLEVKTAEKKDGLVGEGLDGLIVSEAALHDRSTWEQYLQPALSDKRGWAIFPSTPRGFNWYQGLYDLGQHEQLTEYESWRFPTWTNAAKYPNGFDPQCPNDHTTPACNCDEELLQIYRTVSKQYWLQEYGAEFTAFEGQIYTEYDPAIHVREIEYNPKWKNYLALDFGFRDPFVCLDIMVDPSDNVYVWREYQKSGLSTYDHGTYLRNRRNPAGYHIDGIFADPRGADEIATLQPMLGFIAAPDVPWIQGVESIQRLIKLKPDGTPSIYFGRDCIDLNRQINQLRHKEVREGTNVRREGQHDFDDHGPDALRYFTGPYFVLGGGVHLSDIYAPAGQTSEAATFFQLHSGFTRDETMVPW